MTFSSNAVNMRGSSVSRQYKAGTEDWQGLWLAHWGDVPCPPRKFGEGEEQIEASKNFLTI
jgi:hypothetical protein